MSNRRYARLLALPLVIALAGLSAAGCGGNTQSSSDAKTIIVEDTQVGTPQLIDVYNEAAKLFNRSHPGDHIIIKSQTFTQMEDTGVLEISGSHAPSLLQGNQGWESMGTMVKDHLLVPLDSYAKEYHWSSLQSPTLMAIDGRQTPTRMATGSLYGMSGEGDWVGLYYNKSLLSKLGQPAPRTFQQFTTDLQLAKKAGLTAMAVSGGSADQNLYYDLYMIMLANTSSEATIRNLIDGIGNLSWDSPLTIEAAKTLNQWASDGYFPPGYASLSDSARWAYFAKGTSLFTIDGTWNSGSAAQTHAVVDMEPFPSNSSSHGPEGIATGGQPWIIPVNGPNHALAAEFLNFLLGPTVAKLEIKNGQIPALSVPGELSNVTGAVRDSFEGWQQLSTGTVPVPYMDWATPNFFNQLPALCLELTGGQLNPSQFASQLESDYSSYRNTLG